MTVAVVVPEKLWPFQWHGVAFDEESGQDLVADCPFCEKSGSFVVNRKTTKWVCHSSGDSCGRSGNVRSFLQQYWEHLLAGTGRGEWGDLAANRGVHWAAFKDAGVAWDSRMTRWAVPIFGIDGKIDDIRTWKVPKAGKKTKVMTTKGIPACLGGLETVRGRRGRVWIAEGEWDAIALRWLLKNSGRGDEIVLWVPGSRVVKDEWVLTVLAAADEVIIAGDNDPDGDRMAEKWWARLNTQVPLKFVCWPDTMPDKFDLRDFIVKHLQRKREPAKILRLLCTLVSEEHPKMPFVGQADAEAGTTGERAIERRREGPVPVLDDLIAQFSKWLRLTDDLRLAIRFALAIHVSSSWPGDCPLWGFVVGAPGSGKSEILVSMADAPGTVYQSSVNRESLLSGYGGGKDPSLIPKLIGRCGVFKDWTEMLEAHPVEQKKAYSCLRGFYDGRVDKIFGNGVARNYVGTCAMVAGVTNSVHRVEQASVGERFVKFQLPRPPRADRLAIITQAIVNVTKERQKDVDLKAAMSYFLDYHREPLDPLECLGERNIHRLTILTELIGTLRQSVDWGGTERSLSREVAVRAEPEMATRLAKELTRLAIADTTVRGRTTVDDETWRLVERVAFNTAHGFNLDIVEAMMTLGGTAIDVSDLAVASDMPRTTLDRRVESLEVLGIVVRKKVSKVRRPGAPSWALDVTPSVRRAWEEAAPVERHTEQFVEGRIIDND